MRFHTDMRALLGSAIVLLALLSASPVLADSTSADLTVDSKIDLSAALGIELGSAIQVARGQVLRSADGQVSLQLRTGAQLPVQWPAGLAVPVGSVVLVAGTPTQAGPLPVDQVFPAQ